MRSMAGERRPGWWYPWIFFGGLAVVVVVNGILIYFAVHTWSGLDTEDAYRKGIRYNATLAAAQAQEALGWRMDFAFTPRAPVNGTPAHRHRGDLTVTFHGRDGRPLDGLRVKALLVRPVKEGFDSSLELTRRGGGAYGADVGLALPGQWEVRIVAGRGEDRFQAIRRIEVP